MWRDQDRQRRHQHRVVDLRPPQLPDEDVLAQEDRAAMAEALTRLSDRERSTLLAHEVSGQDTHSLAAELGSTAGAVAAQLNRTRARLRVEYLLAADRVEPPTPRCRPVLLALSSGDRRRQREVDAARHLLECELCARLSTPLMGAGAAGTTRCGSPCAPTPTWWRRGRQRASWPPGRVPATDLTEIATAVSEVVRNIVRFADAGEVLVELLDSPRRGIRITARDSGPGIPDVRRRCATDTAPTAGWGWGCRVPGG